MGVEMSLKMTLKSEARPSGSSPLLTTQMAPLQMVRPAPLPTARAVAVVAAVTVIVASRVSPAIRRATMRCAARG